MSTPDVHQVVQRLEQVLVWFVGVVSRMVRVWRIVTVWRWSVCVVVLRLVEME